MRKLEVTYLPSDTTAHVPSGTPLGRQEMAFVRAILRDPRGIMRGVVGLVGHGLLA